MRLGFIGLGNMGYGMVANLLKAGHSIVAFDIDQEKVVEVVKLSAEKAYSLQEIATSVETVILCLPHPDISKDVIFNQNNLSSKLKPQNDLDFDLQKSLGGYPIRTGDVCIC